MAKIRIIGVAGLPLGEVKVAGDEKVVFVCLVELYPPVKFAVSEGDSLHVTGYDVTGGEANALGPLIFEAGHGEGSFRERANLFPYADTYEVFYSCQVRRKM
jgi:hypothetical protein